MTFFNKKQEVIENTWDVLSKQTKTYGVKANKLPYETEYFNFDIPNDLYIEICNRLLLIKDNKELYNPMPDINNEQIALGYLIKKQIILNWPMNL